MRRGALVIASQEVELTRKSADIITGIFVESALMALSPDSEVLAIEHTRSEQENAKKLGRLCSDVDCDKDGKLTQKEFEEGLQRKQMPMLLKMMGLRKHHLLELFSCMAEMSDEDGIVEISSFVNACMLLKGTATEFDLQKLHAEMTAMHAKRDQDMSDIMRLLRGRPRP